MVTKEEVLEALRMVNDPELMMSIVDLGLVYGVKIREAQQGASGTEERPACGTNTSEQPPAVNKGEPPGKAGAEVEVEMTLTSPACPYGPMLIEWTKYACEKVPGVAKCEIKIVWNPPWDPRVMASDEAKLQLGIL